MEEETRAGSLPSHKWEDSKTSYVGVLLVYMEILISFFFSTRKVCQGILAVNFFRINATRCVAQFVAGRTVETVVVGILFSAEYYG